MWSDLLADLKQIELLTVNRFAFLQLKEIIIPISLHGFCDSSSQVYCGMVYCGIVKVLKNALVVLKGLVSIDSVFGWIPNFHCAGSREKKSVVSHVWKIG